MLADTADMGDMVAAPRALFARAALWRYGGRYGGYGGRPQGSTEEIKGWLAWLVCVSLPHQHVHQGLGGVGL